MWVSLISDKLNFLWQNFAQLFRNLLLSMSVLKAENILLHEIYEFPSNLPRIINFSWLPDFILIANIIFIVSSTSGKSIIFS